MTQVRYILWSIFVLCSLGTVSAQNKPIVLSIAIPNRISDAVDSDFFQPFLDEHTDISLNIVIAEDSAESLLPAAFGVEQHLSSIKGYARSADILTVSSSNLSIQATRAGYLLDLAPLIRADPTFDSADFVPHTLESFQWDNGVWALPVSADVTLMAYSRTAFDRAGVAYPNGNWSIEDYVSAIHSLAQANHTISPFPLFTDTPILFRAALGKGFADETTVPVVPDFSDSEIETLVTTWDAMNEAGLLKTDSTTRVSDIPMRLISGFAFVSGSMSDPSLSATLLPHDTAVIRATGFAVSSGTAYPEAAYALLQFLTTRPELTNTFFDLFPARKTIAGAAIEGYDQTGIRVSPDQQNLVNQAVDNALPWSAMLFDDYIYLSLVNRQYDRSPDILTALRDAEVQAIHDLDIAASKRDEPPIVVDTPLSQVSISGKTTLTFGIGTTVTPLPNMNLWNQVAQAFSAADSEIGNITFDVRFAYPEDFSNRTDCFFLNYNAVPGLDLTTVLSLDPLLAADPDFDENDLIPSVITQLQRDNHVWAYPLVLQPYLLRYDRNQFDADGIPEPIQGWTASQFQDALSTLYRSDGDRPVFTPDGTNAAYINLLIAAYGGMPLDFRTSPPSIHFMDPAVVTAIQQVLDLAKSGSITYNRLTGNDHAVGGKPGIIQTVTLNVFQDVSDFETDQEALTTFPVGSSFTPLSFDVGAGYISASGQNPEGCYRWFDTLSRHPELFGAMPARLAAFEDGSVVSSAEQTVYATLLSLLASPNLAVLPSAYHGLIAPEDYPLQVWLNRAYDRYVLEDADLNQELAQAQDFATGYLGCIAGLTVETGVASAEEMMRMTDLYLQCAVRIDPTLTFVLGTN